MSKRCPDCGFVNEDSRIYCGSCGEPLDAELRLIQSLEKQKKNAPTKGAAPKDDPQPASRRVSKDDDDYVPRRIAQEKKSSAAPLIILGVIVAVVIIAIIVLS